MPKCLKARAGNWAFPMKSYKRTFSRCGYL